MNEWSKNAESSEHPVLSKEFSFDDFAHALAFVNQVGQIAEDMQHHPDIELGWGYVRIATYSHDTNSITERDTKLAEAVDALLENPSQNQ